MARAVSKSSYLRFPTGRHGRSDSPTVAISALGLWHAAGIKPRCYPSRVEVRSLGYRTDLAILALEGSQVTDHGDHLVIRTPGNPDYWWGNFLLLRDLKP